MLARIQEGLYASCRRPDLSGLRGIRASLRIRADKAIFATWVADGKPEGDPTIAESTTVAPEAELEDYDLELQISQPFTPTFSNQAGWGMNTVALFSTPIWTRPFI